MGMDIIARASASKALATASAAQAAAVPFDLFNALGSKTLDSAVMAILTGGYTAAGIGAGCYVSDSMANASLAAAHPRFCKASANGRYFRLLADASGAINVRQGGAIGNTPGTNAQPAIQAAVAYACAVGIETVILPDDYELWCPLVTGSTAPDPASGSPIIVRTANGLRLKGRPGGSALTIRNSLGGSKNTITQTAPGGGNWQGGGIRYVPPSGTMAWLALEDLSLDGGVTYNPANRSNLDLTDKGLWVQDVSVGKIDVRNVTLKNFAGEIYYVGGQVMAEQRLENCVFDGSPQSALNPSGGKSFHGTNVQAGNSYQACEVLGWSSFTMIGGRLYDFYSSTIASGPDPAYLPGHPFNYPTRSGTRRPPWTTLDGVQVEGVQDALYLSSWTRGRLVTTDAQIALQPYCSDVQLEIEAWLDQHTSVNGLFFSGPQSLTEQFQGAPAGVFVAPPSNIRVSVSCKRTALAKANSRFFSAAVVFYAGLVDKDSCEFVISGDAAHAFQVSGTPPGGFALPLIATEHFQSSDQPFGGTYNTLTANDSVNVLWPAMTFYDVSSALNVSLGSSYGYCHGQLAVFYMGNATGGSVTFRASDGNLVLPTDRALTRAGDRIDLTYDAYTAKWCEALYRGPSQLTGGGAPASSTSGTLDFSNFAQSGLLTLLLGVR